MIKVINSNSSLYPPQFRVIKNPPRQIYCRGNEKILSGLSVAVVGSRKCTTYGRVVARSIGRRLAENGVTVVSGMAIGIDSAAHQGALDAGGKTIAVLANGVDICYPRQNRELMGEILKDGAVISEFPPGTQPVRTFFPSRNRLISGLAEVVVVVEASYRSGSLITVEHAAEQNKKILTVPGNITSEASFGSNHLMKDERIDPLVVIDDIFTYLSISSSVPERVADALGEEERRLFELIRRRGEMTTDEICVETLFSPQKVKGIITVLEMKGLVVTAMGKVFIDRLEPDDRSETYK